MGIISKIRRDLKREEMWKKKDEQHRLIAPDVYHRLKEKKICDHCHKSMKGKRPEIHHIIPVIKGGTSDENNLMAVHEKCHEKLDKEALG